VPYEADISAALQRLKEDVFVRGAYTYGDALTNEQRKVAFEKLRPEMEPWMQKVKESTMQEPFRTLFLQGLEKLKAQVSGSSALRPKRKPRTIEKLLQFQAESGTHSILDIRSISARPKLGAISPFPHARLVEYFGSETPSHAEIEKAHDSGALEDFVSEKWQGIYIIAYRDGSPFEIFFAGCSGD